MPHYLLYCLIPLFAMFFISCEQNNGQLSGFTSPENDSVLIAHIKEPLLTLVDLETNEIQKEIELPFVISDMVYLEHLDTFVIAGQDQTDLFYYDKNIGSFESLVSLEEGINHLYYIPETMELYASNSLYNTLYRILYCDDDTGNIQVEQVDTGEHPGSLTYSRDLDQLFLANVYDHQIEVFDRQSLQQLDAFHVLDRPNGLLVVDNQLFIGGHGTGGDLNREVHIASLPDQEEQKQIETGLMPVFFEYNPSKNHVLVMNHGSHTISQIDLNRMQITAEQDVSFNPYFSSQYQDDYLITTLDGHELIRVDKNTLDLNHSIPVRPGPHSMIILEGTNP
ncbi:YncE family protein [Salisediminibacterium beveridgei]|uniref:Lipoprotein, putative n=1 Tax=Salisediminibacterium beveridgei TaxID=632773 RepID=A0A1D7QSL9_9BACI|nr:hypothetical protein [Salisediminibacterium beveridgei]AOM81998.1 lipoprotein, putative [Salisediminibacterium beveridgei]